MARDPLKQLLGLPDTPSPEDAAAILAPNQFQSPVLQRGLRDLPGGGQGPDWTPSPYNRELDAQNASTLAEEDRLQQARDKAENDARIAASPNVAAETANKQARAVALAGEPNRVAGVNQLDVQKLKQGPLEKLLEGQQGSAAGPPMQFKPTVSENGITLTGEAPAHDPAQVVAQQHAAQIGLSQYPKMREIIDTLDKHGMIGPIAGRAADAATATGLDKLFLSPEASRAFSDFKAQASLMKSNMAMVHGGARGGSSPQMAARFDALVNTAQTPQALRGAIDTFERWQTQYANAKSSDELDAADAAMGVTPGPYQRPDAYSDPNYQPK